MEWNIHGQGGYSEENYPKQTADIILKNKPDVFILVEFFKYDFWIEEFMNYIPEESEKLSKVSSRDQAFRTVGNEYIVILSDDRGKGFNQTIIGIKKDLNPVITAVRSVIPHGRQLLEIPGLDYLHPEFLQVDLLFDGQPLTIIGTRIKTQGENKDYNIRKKQFVCLMQYIHTLKHPVIVSGDFNNAFCRGNLNKKFDEKDYKGKAQINYNLNLIKTSLDEIGFTMVDVNKDGSSIPTHKRFLPEDHIFVRGFGAIERNFTIIHVEQNLSDHNILFAEL